MDNTTFFLKSKMVWGLVLLAWPVLAVLLGGDAPDSEALASLKAAGDSVIGYLSQMVGTVLAIVGARTPTGTITLKP